MLFFTKDVEDIQGLYSISQGVLDIFSWHFIFLHFIWYQDSIFWVFVVDIENLSIRFLVTLGARLKVANFQAVCFIKSLGLSVRAIVFCWKIRSMHVVFCEIRDLSCKYFSAVLIQRTSDISKISQNIYNGLSLTNRWFHFYSLETW